MPDCNGGAQEPSGTRIACFTPEKISYFLKELPLDYPFPVCSPVIEGHHASHGGDLYVQGEQQLSGSVLTRSNRSRATYRVLGSSKCFQSTSIESHSTNEMLKATANAF